MDTAALWQRSFKKKWQPFKAKDMRIGTVGCSSNAALPLLTPSNKHGTNSDDHHQKSLPIGERPKRKRLVDQKY